MKHRGFIIQRRPFPGFDTSYAVIDATTKRYIDCGYSEEEAKELIDDYLEELYKANDGPFTN